MRFHKVATDSTDFRGYGMNSCNSCAGFRRRESVPNRLYFGCGTIRKYGFGDFQPPGYCFWASSFETLPLMITSSPGLQFTGVETLCLAVSCIESSTRRISSKLRPVLMG